MYHPRNSKAELNMSVCMHACYDVVLALFNASLTVLKLVLLYKILEGENFGELHEIH